jgi:hypothetical protein
MLERPVGATLSVHRAFVVHFGARGPGRRRFSGRVEHLSSGRTAQFASLKDLLTFFGGVLEAPRPRQPHRAAAPHPTDPLAQGIGEAGPTPPSTPRRGESTTTARVRLISPPGPAPVQAHGERRVEP